TTPPVGSQRLKKRPALVDGLAAGVVRCQQTCRVRERKQVRQGLPARRHPREYPRRRCDEHTCDSKRHTSSVIVDFPCCYRWLLNTCTACGHPHRASIEKAEYLEKISSIRVEIPSNKSRM